MGTAGKTFLKQASLRVLHEQNNNCYPVLYYLLKLLILGLLVQQMGIFVETLIRRIVIVMVDPSDTVYDVKAKIEDQQRTHSS